MHKLWRFKEGFAAMAAAFIAIVGAMPSAEAARLVNGPNFPSGGDGCAMLEGFAPWPPGTKVFLDSSCQSFPSIEWAIGGGRIIAAGLSGTKYACLDIAGTTPGSNVVVNPCTPGGAGQRWDIRPGPGSFTEIINQKTKLCLDIVVLGPDVTGVVVNTCGATTGDQLWQIK